MAVVYTFNYTDAKGKKSRRVLLTHYVPSTMYAGTDITELDEEQRGLFSVAVDAAKAKYAEELQRLHEEFDLKHRFRQFKQENMTDIVKESI